MRKLLRSTLNALGLDLTKNLEYDRLTKLVMEHAIRKDSNCVDVGCHEGEMLEAMLRLAPKGTHWAFEPIPEYYQALRKRFGRKCTIMDFALSDHNGHSAFQHVLNAPAYSGIHRRTYAVSKPDVMEIAVELRKLDDVIPPDVAVDFIKIDVEGGELGVMRGAERIIRQYRPVVVFECGLGATDHYGTGPDEIHGFLLGMGYGLFLMKDWLDGAQPLDGAGFKRVFEANSDYYFVAAPAKAP